MAKRTHPDKAKLLLRLREIEIQEQEEQAVLYDWYADSCPCGVPIGQCRTHPRARPDQRPPGTPLSADIRNPDRPIPLHDRGDWRVWVHSAGRGSGKTYGMAKYVNSEVESGRARWVALVNETVADVRTVQIEGPTGLIESSKPWFRPVYEPSKSRVVWPNGATGQIFSAEQPGLLRGPAHHLVWASEVAKWRKYQQETLDQIEFGLRMVIDPMPRLVIDSTPRPTPTYVKLLRDPRTVVTGCRTEENRVHLAPDFMRRMEQKYQGTRLGRQELHAELLTDNPQALWDIDRIERDRRPRPFALKRIVVAVDPAGSIADMARVAAGLPTEDDNDGDDAGIVAAGIGYDDRGYVLADATTTGSPALWGRAAVGLYHALDADLVACEANHGGDNVVKVIRSIDPSVPVKKIHASRGKRTRAEPVASLSEQGRIHFCETFPQLEDELLNWIPGMPSPNRMDAFVFALTELMLEGRDVTFSVSDDPFHFSDVRY